ncbi:MAG TPA: alpha-amylase family glycosyl hydrolase [Candidatus Limnocylindrales bacterium]|nr:alpha-amylase family glycosyl hydrolase [Candidatus Limnocylindrales bacterium]
MSSTAPAPAPSARAGMGAHPFDGGTTFRVWAPHAEAVFVTGTFDEWAGDTTPLAKDGDGDDEAGWQGTWSVDVPGVAPGAEYKFTIRTPDGDLSRIDPYARQVTSSVGNAVVYDPAAFDWGDDDFAPVDWDDLVIYELHVGTFAATADKRGTFDAARRRLPYLKNLGISAVQVMPPFEFAGDISWGYNPSHLFAIESGYGGPDAFKRFIRDAHANGIAVIVDVVYNHLGPSDLDLWRFDGWAENGGGGIYVYNDDRAETPWGATRPDYGRGEVRTFLRDSAMTWLQEFRCDGLRFDATVYIRAIDGPTGARPLPEGWSFMAWINDEVRASHPWKITIAEDLQGEPAIVAPTDQGGAGFGAQWDNAFLRGVRPALTPHDDAHRDIGAVAAAILGEGRGAPMTRVIYTESHDDVANGEVRVPESITPGAADSWWAKKRAVLGSALVLTSPGIPMLFMGQELLEDRWFDDTIALDWEKAESNDGILRFHRDLVALRRARDGATRGLRGPNIHLLRVDGSAKILAYHRWSEGGPHDDTVVIANFADRHVTDLRIGLPAPGRWAVRLNSDSAVYDPAFGGHEAFDLDADGDPMDDCEQSGLVAVGPYSVVVLSREE